MKLARDDMLLTDDERDSIMRLKYARWQTDPPSLRLAQARKTAFAIVGAIKDYPLEDVEDVLTRELGPREG